MTDSPEKGPSKADLLRVNSLNEKAIGSSFFVPDRIYADLALFKDLPLGAILAEALDKKDEERYNEIQASIVRHVGEYQTRRHRAILSMFEDINASDYLVDKMLKDPTKHELIFIAAPVTQFLYLLLKHLLRNQNNSRPAEKYTKKYIDAPWGDNKRRFTVSFEDVSLTVNTYPLTLRDHTLTHLAALFAETLRVNVKFVNKDIAKIDDDDWDDWVKDIDCFYLDDLVAFHDSETIRRHLSEFDFVGTYIFSRKRFHHELMAGAKEEAILATIAKLTAHLGLQSNFEWLTNNDLRLTDEPIGMPEDEDQETSGETS
jgi:hypothetical protein